MTRKILLITCKYQNIRFKMLSKITTLSALVGVGLSAVLYDHAKSDVSIYTQLNFEKQVTKNRESGVSIVHYYKSTGKWFQKLI